MNLCVIPARGGSCRIPGKNIKDFHGRPIIAYSIETAKASGLFDRIVVSTDSDIIGAVALQYGAEVLMRPPALAMDEVGTRQVISHVAREIGGFNYVCGIYATAPMMRTVDLEEGFYDVRTHSHAISVGYPPLQDAAQFYWSSRFAIEHDIEYFDHHTALVKIPAERVCDINVEDDFRRAERMYAALNG